jgi:hypothetical protein
MVQDKEAQDEFVEGRGGTGGKTLYDLSLCRGGLSLTVPVFRCVLCFGHIIQIVLF